MAGLTEDPSRIIPPTKDPVPEHALKAMSRYDKQVARAEEALARAEQAFAEADEAWRSAVQARRAAETGPGRYIIQTSGQPAPEDPTLQSLRQVEAELLEDRARAGVDLSAQRARRHSIRAQRAQAGRLAVYRGADPNFLRAIVGRVVG